MMTVKIIQWDVRPCSVVERTLRSWKILPKLSRYINPYPANVENMVSS